MNALKESKELTKIAKQIFGDIAIKAYFSLYAYKNKEYCSKEEYINEFKYLEDKINDKLEIDTNGIVIKFASGMVSFSASEFGEIEKLESNEYVLADEEFYEMYN